MFRILYLNWLFHFRRLTTFNRRLFNSLFLCCSRRRNFSCGFRWFRFFNFWLLRFNGLFRNNFWLRWFYCIFLFFLFFFLLLIILNFWRWLAFTWWTLFHFLCFYRRFLWSFDFLFYSIRRRLGCRFCSFFLLFLRFWFLYFFSIYIRRITILSWWFWWQFSRFSRFRVSITNILFAFFKFTWSFIPNLAFYCFFLVFGKIN